MSIFSDLFKKKRKQQRNKQNAQNFDYLPLFFWDKSLSNTAKIIMCLVCGGTSNREKTLQKLRNTFSPGAVDSIAEALSQLEHFGYITSESYRGVYGEPRIDKRLCNCPNARLPKLVEPTGAPLYPISTAVEMYDKARDLGFIAETGKDTTYFLYDALRIFSAVENVLENGEQVVLPLIGPETKRQGLDDQSILLEYPCSIIGIIVTTMRVIIVQEDCSAEGRQLGMARFIIKKYSDFRRITLNERVGRITFEDWDGQNSWDGIQQLDIVNAFALNLMQSYFSQLHAFLPSDSKFPHMTFDREVHV